MMTTTTDKLSEVSTPDYLDLDKRPEWVKGPVQRVIKEANVRGLETVYIPCESLKIKRPGTGEVIWFQEVIRSHGADYLTAPERKPHIR